MLLMSDVSKIEKQQQMQNIYWIQLFQSSNLHSILSEIENNLLTNVSFKQAQNSISFLFYKSCLLF